RGHDALRLPRPHLPPRSLHPRPRARRQRPPPLRRLLQRIRRQHRTRGAGSARVEAKGEGRRKKGEGGRSATWCVAAYDEPMAQSRRRARPKRLPPVRDDSIERGLKTRERENAAFFELADRLAATSDRME